jgi:phosphatidylglycerophosphate synthase
MAVHPALYIPNLLGYMRILLAFVGLHYSATRPVDAVVVWIFSSLLDLIDGKVARVFNQCSTLGVLVDIAADNVLRTSIWLAVVAQDDWYRVPATMIICMEWTTMICTQLHATQSGKHWKEQRDNDPWIVKQVFQRNFTSPLGCWVIFGLFGANQFAYGSHHLILSENIPFFQFLKCTAYSGRAISLLIECWMCKGYLSLVVSKDLQVQPDGSSEKKRS